MFCIECGFKNLEHAKFCKRCGTNLNQDVNSSQHQINESHNAAPVNNNLQPQANPRQEPQQVAVGSANEDKYVKTGVMLIIIGMFLILVGPFILVWIRTNIGLSLMGIETPLILIHFIFIAIYGFLVISCRNRVKIDRILARLAVIPTTSSVMLFIIIGMGSESPFGFGLVPIAFGLLAGILYISGCIFVSNFYPSKNQKKLQEHEEEK